MRRAVKAIIRRYLRSKYQGMDSVDYKPFCQYLVQPDPPNEVDRIDSQVDTCRDILNKQPEAIVSIVRKYWGEGLSKDAIASKYDLTPKRVSAVIGTVEYMVVRECIEPETIRA